MGKYTGIKWTDSTWNSWHGCTKCGPACDDCYAEGVDNRTGGGHWGLGAPRKLLSDHARNEPFRWQRGADKFEAEHGRRRRVFTLSMGDLFDNEVPLDWRMSHMATMESCDRLEWQICTKRVSNIVKCIPGSWANWPRHIGVLITVVTQAEADRDVPRLLKLKRNFRIPWVGISYEPAQEMVDFWMFLGENGLSTYGASLDWIIFGGKSGPKWDDRPFSLNWARKALAQCHATNTAFFMKQVAAFRPTDDMIPIDLMIREWPEGH